MLTRGPEAINPNVTVLMEMTGADEEVARGLTFANACVEQVVAADALSDAESQLVETWVKVLSRSQELAPPQPGR